MQYQAESEVKAGRGLPMVAALSDTGGLLQVPITSEVLNLVEVEGFTVTVRGLQ